MARATACFWPYHNALDDALDRFAARGVKPALFVVHSFTPVMRGIQRPWQLGVLWRTDPRLPKPLLAALRAIADIIVGDNEPYSARDPVEYTLQAHAESRGLPHCSIEIRQDLIAQRAGALHWADLIAPALRRAVQASLDVAEAA
jgi:predicted N-formylglutamate amidohydrolase